jgi:hypothetical protein
MWDRRDEKEWGGLLFVSWLHPKENHHSDQGQECDYHPNNNPCITEEIANCAH